LACLLSRRRSLQSLSRDDVERFILDRSRRISRHSLQHEVAHLRAFLLYAHDAGLVRERLDGLDTPRMYRDELPPRALPWPSVLRLLRSIDRTTMRYARADLDLKRRALAQAFPDAVAPPPGGRFLLDGTGLLGWLRRL
jgi:integrase